MSLCQTTSAVIPPNTNRTWFNPPLQHLGTSTYALNALEYFNARKMPKKPSRVRLAFRVPELGILACPSEHTTACITIGTYIGIRGPSAGPVLSLGGFRDWKRAGRQIAPP